MPREYQYEFELRHLVCFRELARQLHFRKAAETLAVAQPALSRALAQLEAAVGADLLNRTRRGAELTPAGRLLLERTSRTFAVWPPSPPSSRHWQMAKSVTCGLRSPD